MGTTPIIVAASLLVLLGATSGAYLKGRSDGKAVQAAAVATQVRELNELLDAKQIELDKLETDRLAQEQLLGEQIDELEKQAREDADADRPALGIDSVCRINSIR